MTITFHWWMAPVVIVLFGIAIAWTHEDRSGCMPDLIGPFSILVSVVIATAICIGHYL